MPRTNFRNWAHEVEAAGKGNLGHLERTFWNSGRAVYQALVLSTITGMKLSAQDRCQLRDWSLWDDEPACAVMNMYMNNMSGVPNLFYAGTCLAKGDAARATTIASQVDTSVKEELFHLIETEAFKIPSFTIPKVVTFDSNAMEGRPKFDSELTVTALRADNTLPVRQSVVDKHMVALAQVHDKVLTEQFELILQAHNAKYNPSQENWSDQRKRVLDGDQVAGSSLASSLAGEGAEIQGSADDAKSKSDLKNSGKVFIVEGKEPFYEHVSDEQGAWYLNAHSDGVLTQVERLATIKWRYKTGAKGQALMEESTRCYKFALASDTDLVTVIVQGELPKSLPTQPVPIKDILQVLESCGKVRTA